MLASACRERWFSWRPLGPLCRAQRGEDSTEAFVRFRSMARWPRWTSLGQNSGVLCSHGPSAEQCHVLHLWRKVRGHVRELRRNAQKASPRFSPQPPSQRPVCHQSAVHLCSWQWLRCCYMLSCWHSSKKQEDKIDVGLTLSKILKHVKDR